MKFSAMSWDDFKAHKYDFRPTTGKTPITAEAPSDVLVLDQENGFYNIIEQIFGATVADKVCIYPCQTEPNADLDKDAFNNGGNAFYGLYDVDDYKTPTKFFEHGTTTEYVPSNLADDKDAIEEAIYDATELDGYINVYNSFWNQAETGAGIDYTLYYAAVESGADPEDIADAKKNAEDAAIAGFAYDVDDVKGYTLATFKPYADEAPIVYFTNGSTIDTTVAMKAILTAVDPETASKLENDQWDGDVFENQSAIFNGGATDFWFFMKAAYDYYVATNTNLVQDLETIKKWINDVEQAFTDDAARKTSGETAYKNDKKAY